MLLKTLNIAGFKSFADRTRLEFGRGVNVVVGPNGTGKSNILDALSWVMGTQTNRSLRTQEMSDVIFAGTATRPRLGRAEVSVTFQNDDGSLPLDLSEVTITRRLLRDGTSEYLLNGASCRLLDVQELLSDGNVGRSQHVLVNQGQIGEILSASPNELRVLVEEAAGIAKHRSRRDRSVRRLENTEIDMGRLQGLLGEHQRRLRPLKRQAKAAIKWESVSAQAQALRLWLGGETLRSLADRHQLATVERDLLEESLVASQKTLLAVDSGLRRSAGVVEDIRSQLDRDTAAAARLEATSARIQGAVMLAGERRRTIERTLEGAGQRRVDLSDELVSLRDQSAESVRAEAAAEEQALVLQLSVVQLDDEERALAEQIQLPTEGVVANLRGDLRSLETAAQRDAHEQQQLERRREAIHRRLEEERGVSGKLVDSMKATEVARGVAEIEYTRLRDTASTARDRADKAEAIRQRALIERERAQTRVHALQAVLDGVGEREARTKALNAQQIVAPVVSAIDVPADLAAAVDAALGEWSDALLAGEVGGVALVASALKAEGLGGISLVAPADRGAAVASEAAEQLGSSTLVQLMGPRADVALAVALMGDVVLVDGCAAGWEVVNRYPSLRAVTLEGDLISTTGMRIAAPDGAGHAVRQAVEAADASDIELARATSLATTAARELSRETDEERAAFEALELLGAELASQDEAFRLNQRSQVARNEELERVTARLTAVVEASTARTERLDQVRVRVAALEGEEQTLQEAWEVLNERRGAVAARRDDERKAAQAAAGAYAAAAERRKLMEARIEAIGHELSQLSDASTSGASVARFEETESLGVAALAAVRSHIESLRKSQADLRIKVDSAGKEVDAAERTRSQLGVSIATDKDRMAELTIELAEVSVRRESVAEGLRRDADSSEQVAIDASEPETPADTDLKELLSSLEAQLRRMGAVNPLAAAECEALTIKVEELDGQMTDLQVAHREIKKVVAALDQEMASMFVVAFEDISRLFEENFSLAFPGGRGGLRLLDPDNPRDTGIEISVQPHGKKVGRLSLLSGGERSLAALAFLCSVFLARPSPFYVLDEVEAALDAANLRRFLTLVDTLRKSAQLVIITHQQQTMHAADTLYGVTMEPGGSSQVISKQFDSAGL